MEKCKILSDYMTLVNYVNDIYNGEQEDDSLTIAISKAIDKCIEEGILVDFLREKRYEVMKVMTLDYTFERQIALEREEAIKEGRAAGLAIGRKEGQEIGRAKGQSEIIRRLLASGMSTEEIANICNKSVKEIEELLKVD